MTHLSAEPVRAQPVQVVQEGHVVTIANAFCALDVDLETGLCGGREAGGRQFKEK